MNHRQRHEDPHDPPAGELPLKALAVMIVLAWGGTLLATLGWSGLVSALPVILTDGVMAAMVLLAAGGYGWAALRFLTPPDTPPLLGAATATAAGLWLLSMAVLAVGSALGGALTMAVWWPVVGVGAGVALWRAQRPLGRLRLPRTLGGDSLVWVIVAIGAGLWLSGAVLPAGWLGNLTGLAGDSAEVLGRHMQLPREFLQDGQVTTLRHNVYSHPPLGTEMLRLLGMCLRGGAYEGMYLAKLIGGLFGVLTVAGAFAGLRDENFRARAAAALLATAPWVVYLAWLALPELASLCYLTLALTWLRRWLARPSARTAGWIGVLLGSSTAAGYPAVGMVAAPVLAAMLVAGFRRPGTLRQTLLAAALPAAMLAPWLIRSAAATGNPVFPLATGALGRGHWDDQSARRWRSAHGGDARPVPLPPERDAPPRPSRRDALVSFLLGPQLALRLLGGRGIRLHTVLGAGVLAVLAATLLAMLLRPRGPTGWDWALLGVLAVQLLVWVFLSGSAPARSASVCVGPISLLCAGGLARLAGVREVRWLRQSPGVGSHWGLAPAALLLIAAAVGNVMSARRYWSAEMSNVRSAPAGLPARHCAAYSREFSAANAAAKPGRLALIGEDRPFYFPPDSRYATPFDPHPLAGAFARSRSGAELSGRLAQAGVTHVFVAWTRIEHFAGTIGWPATLAGRRLAGLLGDWPIEDEFWYPPAPATAAAGTQPGAAPGTQPATATAPAATTRPRRAPKRIFTLFRVPNATTTAASGPAAPG